MFGFKDKKKEVMIFSDGGISSQISFHALGLSFEERGYEVKYDLKWFREHGKDLNGQFNRSFTMDKAFPAFDIKIATPDEAAGFYKKHYQKHYDFEHPRPKLYIRGYQNRLESFIKYRDVFVKNFNPTDKDICADILKDIETTNSCAVHVRRGDLSNFDPYYGNPTSVEYFVNAIKIIRGLAGHNAVFYFFSEELDWVKENILPNLDKDIKCVLVEGNDSDKGYLDLYLISRAKSVIASHGSFGIYGRLLSKYTSEGYIVLPKKKLQFANDIKREKLLQGHEILADNLLSNVIFLSNI